MLSSRRDRDVDGAGKALWFLLASVASAPDLHRPMAPILVGPQRYGVLSTEFTTT